MAAGPDGEEEPLEQTLAYARDRAERFQAWLEQLRAGDPVFAEASGLHPWDMSEWQGAVYLLTGCDLVWSALAASVIAERSIGPAIYELAEPRRAWSASETAVMAWAAHFWDVGQRATPFPWMFEEFYFQRWITACHLRHRSTPALMLGPSQGP